MCEDGIEKYAPHNHCLSLLRKVRKKAKVRNQYNKTPQLTQDTIWESDKTQEDMTNKRAMRLGLSQQVTRNRQDSMTDKKHK